MRRVISFLLLTSMLLALTACGDSAKVEEAVLEATEESTSEVETTTVETTEDPMAEDMEILSAIGEVSVENGILIVSVTVPASIVGEDVDQAQLDADAGTTYQSAKVNDDGSVTYKMTRAQHKEMLEGMKESIDQALQEMIESPDFNFQDIKYNSNMSEFEVTMTTTELGLGDSFSVIAFYMYGSMYQIFCGDKSESIIVNFYASDGTLINTADSANMQ